MLMEPATRFQSLSGWRQDVFPALVDRISWSARPPMTGTPEQGTLVFPLWPLSTAFFFRICPKNELKILGEPGGLVKQNNKISLNAKPTIDLWMRQELPGRIGMRRSSPAAALENGATHAHLQG